MKVIDARADAPHVVHPALHGDAAAMSRIPG